MLVLDWLELDKVLPLEELAVLCELTESVTVIELEVLWLEVLWLLTLVGVRLLVDSELLLRWLELLSLLLERLVQDRVLWLLDWLVTLLRLLALLAEVVCELSEVLVWLVSLVSEVLLELRLELERWLELLELLHWLLELSSTGTAMATFKDGVTSGAFCSVAGAPGLGSDVLNFRMPGSLWKPL